MTPKMWTGPSAPIISTARWLASCLFRTGWLPDCAHTTPHCTYISSCHLDRRLSSTRSKRGNVELETRLDQFGRRQLDLTRRSCREDERPISSHSRRQPIVSAQAQRQQHLDMIRLLITSSTVTAALHGWGVVPK